MRAQQPPPATAGATDLQPNEIETTITGDSGFGAAGFAVPGSSRSPKDAETVAIAKTVGQVLFDDLNFEREFALIPRDVHRPFRRRPRLLTCRSTAGAS